MVVRRSRVRFPLLACTHGMSHAEKREYSRKLSSLKLLAIFLFFYRAKPVTKIKLCFILVHGSFLLLHRFSSFSCFSLSSSFLLFFSYIDFTVFLAFRCLPLFFSSSLTSILLFVLLFAVFLFSSLLFYPFTILPRP